MKTETLVKTSSGLVQYFRSTEMMLAHYNARIPVYEIRHGCELWHNGHNYKAGIIETIPARD